MQFDVPFTVEYDTPRAVPLSEIIDSLVGLQTLLEDGANNLGFYVRGLTVEQVRVQVRVISQESPLRELFLVSLILAFQQDLEQEVPDLVHSLTGIDVPDSWDTLLTVSVLIGLFYGIGYVMDLVGRATKSSASTKTLDNLVADMAARSGQTEDQIRDYLRKHYGTPSKVKRLANAAIKFVRPSKSQGNARIQVEARAGIRTGIVRLAGTVPDHSSHRATELRAVRKGGPNRFCTRDRRRNHGAWQASRGRPPQRIRQVFPHCIT